MTTLLNASRREGMTYTRTGFGLASELFERQADLTEGERLFRQAVDFLRLERPDLTREQVEAEARKSVDDYLALRARERESTMPTDQPQARAELKASATCIWTAFFARRIGGIIK